MIPQKVEIRFDNFDIVQPNDTGADEPYVWTFFVKLDGTAINLISPQNSKVEVISPAGSHHDLGLPGGEMRTADAPRSIPKSVGRWETTLEQGNLLNLVIPQIAVAALIIGWEEDMVPSTAAMEEARVAVTNELNGQLTTVVRDVVQNCLANPANCTSDVDFESEISVDRLREVILDILKDKMAGFIAGAVLANPLFAFVAGHVDDFIGYGLAGPFFLPRILGSPDFREDFTLELEKGEKDTPGHYRVKGHVALIEPRIWAQPAAAQNEAKVHVVARETVTDMFFQTEMGGGEIGPFRHIGDRKFQSGPTTALSADGNWMHVIGLGLDNHFWRTRSNNGGKDWHQPWTQMSGHRFTSPPAVAMSADARLVKVFGRGHDDRIWMSRAIDGGQEWTDWQAIGQAQFVSGAGACCSADGQRLYVFGTGPDKRVYMTVSINGGRSWHQDWTPIHSAGLVESRPAAVCSDDGKIVRVFCRRDERHIFWASSDHSGAQWRGWFRMESGRFISSPAASMSGDGKRIHVFAIGENMLLNHNASSDSGVTFKTKFSNVDDNSTFY